MTQQKLSPLHRAIRTITYCAVLIALGMVLPFLTGQVPEVGSALSPLHIPALLAGFTVGPLWGAVCAFVIPILRSVIFTMPPLFPKACAMAFEMATYAAVAGFLQRYLPKTARWLYLTQLNAMLLGRVIYGIAFALFTTVSGSGSYSFTAFVTGSFIEGLPGILLHLAIVPPIVLALRKAKLTLE